MRANSRHTGRARTAYNDSPLPETAVRGNVTMLIHLGKQMLGQRDYDSAAVRNPNAVLPEFIVETYPEDESKGRQV